MTADIRPIKGLAEAESAARGRGPAPVHLWNPPFCGDMDLRIAGDGAWYYLGTPIARERLVRLFASVLRHDEDGKYYLVTPIEKIGITVDDAPFLAVTLSVEGAGPNQTITFHTNVGDDVIAGPDHPMRFVREPENDGFKTYIHVRGRLEALVSRALTYDLVEHGAQHMDDGASRFGIWSGGRFFAMALASEVAVP